MDETKFLIRGNLIFLTLFFLPSAIFNDTRRHEKILCILALCLIETESEIRKPKRIKLFQNLFQSH